MTLGGPAAGREYSWVMGGGRGGFGIRLGWDGSRAGFGAVLAIGAVVDAEAESPGKAEARDVFRYDSIGAGCPVGD